MFVRPIKALFYSIALITLLATTASQQVQAVGLTRQPTTTGDKVHLAAAALSGPVSMAAIAYPDSRLLGCAEHVLKTIDEFMAMAQYREFHPSLIGWFCYDVYHAFTALQGPTVQPMIDTDIDDQLTAIEADDANEKPIPLSNRQRSTLKQFIRYVFAGVEASTRVVAACNNGQAQSPAHATYLWNSRGFVHSITSLARLTNYYLETEKDDRKAVLFALMIINAVGSVAYFTGSKNAYTAYSAEQRTLQAQHHQLQAANAQAATASTTASAAPRRNAAQAATGATASAAATNTAPTRRTANTDRPARNAISGLGSVAAAQDVVTPIIAMPSTAAAVSANRSRLAFAPRPTPPARSLPTVQGLSNFEDDVFSRRSPLPTADDGIESATDDVTDTSLSSLTSLPTTADSDDEQEATDVDDQASLLEDDGLLHFSTDDEKAASSLSSTLWPSQAITDIDNQATQPTRSLPTVQGLSNDKDDALSRHSPLPTKDGSDDKAAIVGQTADQPTVHTLAQSATPLVDQKTSAEDRFPTFCANQAKRKDPFNDFQTTVQAFCQERAALRQGFWKEKAVYHQDPPILFRPLFNSFCDSKGIERFFVDEALGQFFERYMERVGGFSFETAPALCKSFQDIFEQLAPIHARLKQHDSKEPILNYEDFKTVVLIFYNNRFNQDYHRQIFSRIDATPADEFYITFHHFCLDIKIWDENMEGFSGRLYGVRQYIPPYNATPQDIAQFLRCHEQMIETDKKLAQSKT